MSPPGPLRLTIGASAFTLTLLYLASVAVALVLTLIACVRSFVLGLPASWLPVYAMLPAVLHGVGSGVSLWCISAREPRSLRWRVVFLCYNTMLLVLGAGALYAIYFVIPVPGPHGPLLTFFMWHPLCTAVANLAFGIAWH